MKLSINITGQIKEEEMTKIRGAVDKLLQEHFKSFKFTWQLLRGLEK